MVYDVWVLRAARIVHHQCEGRWRRLDRQDAAQKVGRRDAADRRGETEVPECGLSTSADQGVAANLSSMLNLPSEIETLSPNFWETFRDRSVVVPPRSGSATAVLTGTIEPSPCMLAF